MADTAKRSRGSGRRVRGAFAPEARCGVPQPDIIEHFDNTDAVPQPPERCLSRQAGIVRCCLREIPTVLSIAGLIIVLIALAMLVLSDKKQEVVEE